jgi:hypothetical protein
VTLWQVTRRVPAKTGATRQIYALSSRDDLTAGEVCWRLSSRWREENYFRYARTHLALCALDSYAATPDDSARLVPNPAKKAAPARIRLDQIAPDMVRLDAERADHPRHPDGRIQRPKPRSPGRWTATTPAPATRHTPSSAKH